MTVAISASLVSVCRLAPTPARFASVRRLARCSGVLLIVAALCGVAGANGRSPATSTIHFQQTHEGNIVAGLTFGLVISHDGGASWHWMCEAAVGYGGMYDPAYAYTQAGTIFATTFDGFKVNRSGCTFDAMASGKTFVSADALGPDHALYYAASDAADVKIYKSTDDGMTFPTAATPGQINDWWSSIVVAPSDPMRVYLTGYRTTGGQPRRLLLLRSDDGGATFPITLSSAELTTSDNSQIKIAGVDKANPNIVFARTSFETGNSGESIYRSTNGGTSWTKILTKSDPCPMFSNDPCGLSFVLRADGTCVAATVHVGAVKSTDCETATTPTWTDLVGAPHINCLVENAAGEVWACTHNYDSPTLPADGFGIMKSVTLATWTGVLKFQDIAGPVDCAAGTTQRDLCVESVEGAPSAWCCLEQQLGITSSAVDCSSAPRACGSVATDVTVVAPKGCCNTSGNGAPAALVLAIGVGILVVRPRRRVRPEC